MPERQPGHDRRLAPILHSARPMLPRHFLPFVILSLALPVQAGAQSCVGLDSMATYPSPTSLEAARGELARHGFARDMSAQTEQRYRAADGRTVLLIEGGGRCFGSRLTVTGGNLEAEFDRLAPILTRGMGKPTFGSVNEMMPMDVERVQQLARGADSIALAWANADHGGAMIVLALNRTAGKLPPRVVLGRMLTGYKDSLARLEFKAAAGRRTPVDTTRYALVHADDISRQLVLRSSVRTIAPGVVTVHIRDEVSPGVKGAFLGAEEFDVEYRCATRRARFLSTRMFDRAGKVLRESGPDSTDFDASDHFLAEGLRFGCPKALVREADESLKAMRLARGLTIARQLHDCIRKRGIPNSFDSLYAAGCPVSGGNMLFNRKPTHGYFFDRNSGWVWELAMEGGQPRLLVYRDPDLKLPGPVYDVRARGVLRRETRSSAGFMTDSSVYRIARLRACLLQFGAEARPARGWDGNIFTLPLAYQAQKLPECPTVHVDELKEGQRRPWVLSVSGDSKTPSQRVEYLTVREAGGDQFELSFDMGMAGHEQTGYMVDARGGWHTRVAGQASAADPAPAPCLIDLTRPCGQDLP